MTTTTDLAPRQQNGNGNAMDLRRPIGNQATLKGLLEASKAQIAMVLPQHVTPERIIKVALIAAVNNPRLLECTRESVLQSIMQAASLGLDPGGPLGSAYLVPYKDKCTLIPGYRGLIDLARRSGEIVSINAEVVYQQDKFLYRKGVSPVLNHEPALFDELRDDDIVGAYMVAHLRGEGIQIEFMNRQQIEAIRRKSMSGSDQYGNAKGIWRDHYAEMCRKTVVRRGFKYLPVSSERLMSAIEHDNRVDGLADNGQATQNRVSYLNARLTARPVSEGHRLIPDDEMMRNDVPSESGPEFQQDADAAPTTPDTASASVTVSFPPSLADSGAGGEDGPAMSADEKAQAAYAEWVQVVSETAAENRVANAIVAAAIKKLYVARGLVGRKHQLSAQDREQVLMDLRSRSRTGLFPKAGEVRASE